MSSALERRVTRLEGEAAPAAGDPYGLDGLGYEALLVLKIGVCETMLGWVDTSINRQELRASIEECKNGLCQRGMADLAERIDRANEEIGRVARLRNWAGR